MNADALVLVKHLKSPFRNPDIHLLAIILVKYAVKVLIDVDMIIKADFAREPFVVFILVIRKFSGIGFVKFFKQLLPGLFQLNRATIQR